MQYREGKKKNHQNIHKNQYVYGICRKRNEFKLWCLEDIPCFLLFTLLPYDLIIVVPHRCPADRPVVGGSARLGTTKPSNCQLPQPIVEDWGSVVCNTMLVSNQRVFASRIEHQTILFNLVHMSLFNSAHLIPLNTS